MKGYKISTAMSDMDIDVIHDYLSRSYWAEGIPRDTLINAMYNSLCFGIFTNNMQQIGFGRVVTDTATFAYLADVFTLDEYQGRGLASWLIQEILAHPSLQGLRRINLATKDAHSLYEMYGFKSLSEPQKMMELINPDVYKKN